MRPRTLGWDKFFHVTTSLQNRCTVCERTWMRTRGSVSDLTNSHFIVEFCDSQRLYGNVLPFEYPHPNIGESTGSLGHPGEIELGG